MHILSVGSDLFTTDRRFSSRLADDRGRYVLVLRAVRRDDEGGYECQISTKPTKAFLINLTVRGNVGREEELFTYMPPPPPLL